MRFRTFAACALVAIAAAACGGGGGGGSVSPGLGSNTGSGSGGTNPGTTTATPTPAANGGGGSTTTQTIVKVPLTITIPKAASTSSLIRRPAYIPSTTGSLVLTLQSVNGVSQPSATPQGPFNLSPTNNPSCSAGANGTTCTFQVSAPVGTDIFVATTYTSNNGTGQALGSGAVRFSVSLNSTNAASLTLAGPVASVQLFSSALLYNGNPIPQATATGCNDCAIARNAHTAAAYRQQFAARHPQVIATATPTPAPTSTPVSTSSRVFVIATDAQGNQIINPTTFDIPIQIQLNLNGLTPGTVSLNVAYSGLPGEPSGSVSTSSDGGTVTVYAPTDVVSLNLNGGANAIGGPGVVANYTPQGGSPQSSSPLTIQVYAPPPAAQFALTETVPQMGVNQPTTHTITLTNTGTLATSGTVEVDDYLDTYYAALTFNNTNGTSAVWACNFLYGYDVQCLSNAAIPAGTAAPQILVNVTPTNPTQYGYLDVAAYGSAVNSGLEIFSGYVLTVNGCAGPGIVLCPSSVALPANGSNSAAVTIAEANYAGTFSASGCAGIATANISGNQLTVTGTAAGSCTLTVSDTNSNSATLPIQVTTLAVTGS